MAFAIARIQKSKTKNSIAGLGAHVERTIETPNADPKMTPKNQTIIGSGDWLQDWENRIEEMDISSFRKNAILSVNFVLSASPEFFKNEAGKRDDEKTQNWADKTLDWLEKEFGKNIVSVNLNLDETSPHFHVQFVPILDEPQKSPRLAAAHWFDGRVKLSKFQDSYANAMRPLGLDRGVKKDWENRAHHVDIRKYYQKINQMMHIVDDLEASHDKGFEDEKQIKKLLDKISELSNEIRETNMTEGLKDIDKWLEKIPTDESPKKAPKNT